MIKLSSLDTLFCHYPMTLTEDNFGGFEVTFNKGTEFWGELQYQTTLPNFMAKRELRESFFTIKSNTNLTFNKGDRFKCSSNVYELIKPLKIKTNYQELFVVLINE